MSKKSAHEAIELSRREDRIVRIADWGEAELDVLIVACDDYVDTDAEIEFWGAGWRVHLVCAVRRKG